LSLAQERMDALVRDRLDHQLLHEVIVESSDDLAKSILQAAVRFNSDCIVLATHARRGVDTFPVGSVAEKVIRDATCPVLTIAARRASCSTRPALIEGLLRSQLRPFEVTVRLRCARRTLIDEPDRERVSRCLPLPFCAARVPGQLRYFLAPAPQESS
jgi:Universal stress protein family